MINHSLTPLLRPVPLNERPPGHEEPMIVLAVTKDAQLPACRSCWCDSEGSRALLFAHVPKDDPVPARRHERVAVLGVQDAAGDEYAGTVVAQLGARRFRAQVPQADHAVALAGREGPAV